MESNAGCLHPGPLRWQARCAGQAAEMLGPAACAQALLTRVRACPCCAGVPLLLHGAAAGAVVASVFGFLLRWCNVTIPRFFTGKHPAPRNKVPGEWAPAV